MLEKLKGSGVATSKAEVFQNRGLRAHTKKGGEAVGELCCKPFQVLHWSEIQLRKMRPSAKKAAALLMSCGLAIRPTTPSMLSEENPYDLCNYHELVQENGQEKLIQYVKVLPGDRAGRGEQHTGWQEKTKAWHGEKASECTAARLAKHNTRTREGHHQHDSEKDRHWFLSASFDDIIPTSPS